VRLGEFYPQIKAEPVGIRTYGDNDKTTPISDIEGSDFFTDEIEEALLKGEIDFAVHSAKDLPKVIDSGLSIAAVTKPLDRYDALVSRGGLRIDELRKGAKIGASSRRRKEQLKNYRADLELIDIRGNIEERLEVFDKNGLDALIVAACALLRLGLEERLTQRIPFKIMKPHPLQGALAIQTKKDNPELIKLLGILDER